MSIQLLLKKLQDLEPWEEWQQYPSLPFAIYAESGRVIVHTRHGWCINGTHQLHLFDSWEDVYSFVERASVLGQFKAL